MTIPAKRIVIVGGGTAGWMAAAAFSKALPKSLYSITLVESKNIATVGVGEATIPPIETFNKLIGISPKELIKSTNGTFKLGIEFINWHDLGESYYHPFGSYGTDIYNLPFYQYWHKLKQIEGFGKLSEYSLNTIMAEKAAFLPPQNIQNSPLSKIQFAYHFDATLYAALLQKLSVKAGVTHISEEIVNVQQNEGNGFISGLTLANGQNVEGDFFVDCTGFSGLLIEKTLNTGYESWEKYLLCDSAIAVASEASDEIPSHTKAIAHGFGWQWKIPLQHRTGNGHVYSSKFLSDSAAEQTLLNNLETSPIAETRQLRFTPGKRLKSWNKNCLALGLASGFVEPLESTSIHLIQSAISKFLGLFPNFDHFDAEQRRFNQLVDQQQESIRDFIILHYKATQREDTDFWKYCKNMDVPSSLSEKLELYRSSGHISKDEGDLFSENSWFSVLEGQGIEPDSYCPLADQIAENDLKKTMNSMREVIRKCAETAPKHAIFIDKQLQ